MRNTKLSRLHPRPERRGFTLLVDKWKREIKAAGAVTGREQLCAVRGRVAAPTTCV